MKNAKKNPLVPALTAALFTALSCAAADGTWLSPSQGRSKADVVLVPGGAFKVAAGETATVHSVTVRDAETGKERYLSSGLYCASGAGVAGARGVDWMQGAGLLRVTSSLERGTMFLLR